MTARAHFDLATGHFVRVASASGHERHRPLPAGDVDTLRGDQRFERILEATGLPH